MPAPPLSGPSPRARRTFPASPNRLPPLLQVEPPSWPKTPEAGRRGGAAPVLLAALPRPHSSAHLLRPACTFHKPGSGGGGGTPDTTAWLANPKRARQQRRLPYPPKRHCRHNPGCVPPPYRAELPPPLLLCSADVAEKTASHFLGVPHRHEHGEDSEGRSCAAPSSRTLAGVGTD